MNLFRIRRSILLAVLCGLAVLAAYGYVQLNYFDGYKKIDLRKEWPNGRWQHVQFVEINFGNEWLNFEVPKDKLKEFQDVLRQEVHLHSRREDISNLDQLRIVTDTGKYYTPVLYDSLCIKGRTWRSDKLRTLLGEWNVVSPVKSPFIDVVTKGHCDEDD